MNYCEVLESYTIIDDPDVIAIESFIYSALESDTSDINKLKNDLNNLVKAKASGNDSSVKRAKDEVDDSIKDVNEIANKEKDLKRKAKLKKFVKIAGIIAGSLATAATVAVVAKKIKDNINTSNKEQENKVNAMREEMSNSREEFEAARREIQKAGNEIRQKINKSAADIETRRTEFEEKTRQEMDEMRKAHDRMNEKHASAWAQADLTRKLATGEGEFTEEEAAKIKKLTTDINKGVANLAKARLGSNYNNIRHN